MTASNPTITYGQPFPTLTYSYGPLVNSDTSAVVSGAPALTTTAIATSNPGSYPITVVTGTLAAANYSFLYVPGTLTIQQASQTITFAAPSSPVTYGVLPITLTASGGASGNPVLFSIDPSSTPGAGSVSGNTLKITGAGTLVIDANQLGNTNYTAAAQVQRTIAVSKAALTVTAVNASRAYGAANPTFSASYGPYVNGDSAATAFTGSPSLTTTATTTSLPGSYPITAALGSLASTKYSFNFVNGTLTVTFTGSVPASGTACNGAYSGTFSGNLTVTGTQACILVGGGASGNITESGGNLVLSGATVGGNVTISGASTFTIGPSSTIKGNLQIQSLTSGSATNQVCSTTINGNLQFQSNKAPVLIGSSSTTCAGNTIKGSLQVISNTAAITLDGNTVSGAMQVESNSATVTMDTNKVSGALQVQSNSAAVTMDTNKISGALQVQSNGGATTIDGNTVGGALQDQSNAGATQVISNIITGALQCSGNTTITGSGNTAASKTGQCAKF